MSTQEKLRSKAGFILRRQAAQAEIIRRRWRRFAAVILSMDRKFDQLFA
jgi:hypothetical protein